MAITRSIVQSANSMVFVRRGGYFITFSLSIVKLHWKRKRTQVIRYDVKRRLHVVAQTNQVTSSSDHKNTRMIMPQTNGNLKSTILRCNHRHCDAKKLDLWLQANYNTGRLPKLRMTSELKRVTHHIREAKFTTHSKPLMQQKF